MAILFSAKVRSFLRIRNGIDWIGIMTVIFMETDITF